MDSGTIGRPNYKNLPGLAFDANLGFVLSVGIVQKICQSLCRRRNALVDSLVGVFLPGSFSDQRCQLTLGHITLMEHHAPDNDAIDGVHLRQATVNLLPEEAIGHVILHAIGVSNLLANALQCIHGDSVATTAIRAIGAVAEADMPCRGVAFTCPLETLALLPERAHDVTEFFVGQGCPGRISRQVIGLLSTEICLV